MKKIAAHTLLELIVVLAISGIVLLNIIGLYLYVQKQFQIYKNQIDSEIETVQFMSSLTNDVNFASTITFQQNELIIEKANGKKVFYNFKENEVLRKLDRVDTFSVSIKIKDISSYDHLKLVNTINLIVSRGNNNSLFGIIKNYNNATIVNQEIKLSEYGN